jgi:hypothetical protein
MSPSIGFPHVAIVRYFFGFIIVESTNNLLKGNGTKYPFFGAPQGLVDRWPVPGTIDTSAKQDK